MGEGVVEERFGRAWGCGGDGFVGGGDVEGDAPFGAGSGIVACSVEDSHGFGFLWVVELMAGTLKCGALVMRGLSNLSKVVLFLETVVLLASAD